MLRTIFFYNFETLQRAMQLHWHQFHILVCARETILHVEIVHGTNVISTSSDAMWSPLFLFILSILSPYALFAISLCHLVNIFISQMEYSAPKGIYFFCFFFCSWFWVSLACSVTKVQWPCTAIYVCPFLFSFHLSYCEHSYMPSHAKQCTYLHVCMCWIFSSFFSRFFFIFHLNQLQ